VFVTQASKRRARNCHCHRLTASRSFASISLFTYYVFSWRLQIYCSKIPNLKLIEVILTSGRAVYGVGLLPLACWDCGFESRRGHECLSLVSVMYFQVKVSASGWSLVQRSPTKWVCLSVVFKPRQWRGHGPLGAVAPLKRVYKFSIYLKNKTHY
jgi:hypothetical protein